MFARPHALRAAVAILAMGMPLSAVALPAGPQTAPDALWSPWHGCWELVQETEAGLDSRLEGRRLVCIEPGDATRSVRMTTWVDDEVVLLQEIVADGGDRDVTEGGCSGLENARFSADGQRVLFAAELACEGQPLRTSGISLLPGSTSWTDIQVSEVGDQRELLVRRYRRSEAGDRLAAEAPRHELLVKAARQAASAPIDADDVIEALDVVDPAAVEALLLEAGDEFPMDTDLLLRLADAGVPENVIDLMVALSFPDHFAVHEGDEEEAWDRNRYRRGRWGYYGPYYAYGYYDPFFSPYSYRYWGGPGGVIVGGGGGPRLGGKVVNGRGYTRVVARDNGGGGGLSGLFSGGRSSRGDSGRSSIGSAGGGSSGRVAVPRGGSSSGSRGSTGRTAKPRGGSGESGAKPKGGSGF